MTAKEQIGFAMVIVILICGAWIFRWEVTPVSGGEGIGRAYMLNRLTGALFYMRGKSEQR